MNVKSVLLRDVTDGLVLRLRRDARQDQEGSPLAFVPVNASDYEKDGHRLIVATNDANDWRGILANPHEQVTLYDSASFTIECSEGFGRWHPFDSANPNDAGFIPFAFADADLLLEIHAGSSSFRVVNREQVKLNPPCHAIMRCRGVPEIVLA